MSTGTRICKICGEEYEYCRTDRPTGMFRWQDVGCCPEHAEKYFLAVLKDRGEYNDKAKLAEMRAEIAAGKKARKHNT